MVNGRTQNQGVKLWTLCFELLAEVVMAMRGTRGAGGHGHGRHAAGLVSDSAHLPLSVTAALSFSASWKSCEANSAVTPSFTLSSFSFF